MMAKDLVRNVVVHGENAAAVLRMEMSQPVKENAERELKDCVWRHDYRYRIVAALWRLFHVDSAPTVSCDIPCQSGDRRGKEVLATSWNDPLCRRLDANVGAAREP